VNDKTKGAGRTTVPAGPARSPGPREPGRIEWLFRDAARERRIHPLMRLVQDYRRGAAGAPLC
jgi:hypothetical protein